MYRQKNCHGLGNEYGLKYSEDITPLRVGLSDIRINTVPSHAPVGVSAHQSTPSSGINALKCREPRVDKFFFPVPLCAGMARFGL